MARGFKSALQIALPVALLLGAAACVPETAPVAAPGNAASAAAPAVPGSTTTENRPVPFEVEEAIWSFDDACVDTAGDAEAAADVARALGFRILRKADGSVEGRRRTALGYDMEFEVSAPDAVYDCEVRVLTENRGETIQISRSLRRIVNDIFVRRGDRRFDYDHSVHARFGKWMHEFEIRERGV